VLSGSLRVGQGLIAYAAAMTGADAGAPLAEPTPSPATTPATTAASEPAVSPVLRGCPFLMSEEGGWRLDMPSRDHRCAAFSPPAPLAPDKQARLCLTANHLTCATYLASLAARETRLGSQPSNRATRWGLARTTSVIVDPGGIRTRVLGVALDRRRWPAIPAVLLVVTLFVLAVTGLRGVLPATGVGATPSAPPATQVAVAVTSSPPPAFTLPPTGSVEPTTEATVAPTTAPSPSPNPTAAPKPTFRTYVVKSGDTLSGIASRFHTTVSKIAALNHISDPSKLRVGQVLLIPN
jgi:LysM repeat protein